jgi:hypothetical protein
VTCDHPDFEKLEPARRAQMLIADIERVPGIQVIESTPCGSGITPEPLDPTFSCIAAYRDEENKITQNLVGVIWASHIALGLVRAYKDGKRGTHGIPFVTKLNMGSDALDRPSAGYLGRLSSRDELHIPRKVREAYGLRKTNFNIGRVAAGGFFVQHLPSSEPCKVLIREARAEPEHNPDNPLVYHPYTWAVSSGVVQRHLHIDRKPSKAKRSQYLNRPPRAAYIH